MRQSKRPIANGVAVIGDELMEKTMRAKHTLVGALAAAMMLSACGEAPSSATRVAFDGQFFRANAKAVDKKRTPTEFTVTVNGVSASFDGAREAGRFEATKYCVQNFGSSRINWTVGPDTDPQSLRIENDKLTFAGMCQRP